MTVSAPQPPLVSPLIQVGYEKVDDVYLQLEHKQIEKCNNQNDCNLKLQLMCKINLAINVIKEIIHLTALVIG